MLHSTNPIIKHKTSLLNLAEELGNVSQVWNYGRIKRYILPLSGSYE